MAQKTRIAINGFGRIGRKIARLALEKGTAEGFEIVAINDLSKPEVLAHLLKHDSVHGTFKGEVRLEGSTLIAGGQKIRLTAEKDPTALGWKDVGATFVHECTGVFTEKAKASLHLKAGARKVIISAPSSDPDVTICMGVNESAYDASKHDVVSNASCTTNCLAPLAKVLDDSFGIVRGTMLTVHSYTNDQQLLDLSHKDLKAGSRRCPSQIPTSTGAAKAVGLVLPHLKGKIDGLSIRVPTPNVSMVDFTGVLRKSATRDEINAAFKTASEGSLKGILGYSTEPLVSTDFNGNIASSTIDAELTNVVDGGLIKVISWYDNESGFSARMLDLTRWMAQKGL